MSGKEEPGRDLLRDREELLALESILRPTMSRLKIPRQTLPQRLVFPVIFCFSLLSRKGFPLLLDIPKKRQDARKHCTFDLKTTRQAHFFRFFPGSFLPIRDTRRQKMPGWPCN
jgi:hypothetical protein